MRTISYTPNRKSATLEEAILRFFEKKTYEGNQQFRINEFVQYVNDVTFPRVIASTTHDRKLRKMRHDKIVDYQVNAGVFQIKKYDRLRLVKLLDRKRRS